MATTLAIALYVVFHSLFCDRQANPEIHLQANEKQIKSTEVKDNVESFNFAKFTPAYADQPFHPFFEPYRAEMADFSRVREAVRNYSFDHMN
jgi:hypothetical protein